MNIGLARKRAKRFFTYHKLTLPVDIESILLRYADVRYQEIPLSADGICINGNGKPCVFIKNNISKARKRFTCAHELGHIQMPEHSGIITCTADSNFISVNESEYQKIEAEANAFASELLIPSDWVQQLLDSNMTLESILATICDKSEVSFSAAVYSVLNLRHQQYEITVYYNEEAQIHEGQRHEMLRDTEAWIKLNCIQEEIIERNTMSLYVRHFKHILTDNELAKYCSLLNSTANVEQFVNSLLSENISYAHLIVQLSTALPLDYVVRFSLNSSGCCKYTYNTGSVLLSAIYDNYQNEEWLKNNSEYSYAGIRNGLEIKVWKLQNFKKRKFLPNSCPSKNIFNAILKGLPIDNKQQSSINGRVNGTIGAMNNQIRNYTEQQFLDLLVRSFKDRDDLCGINKTDVFYQFLVNKVNELYKKNG